MSDQGQQDIDDAATSESVGDGISARNASWAFSGDVAESFSSHVRRSIPLYDTGHDLICRVSDYFVHDGSVVYELGVSTATLLRKLADRHRGKPSARFVGIDIEASMLEQARREIGHIEATKLELEHADINLFEYEKSDLIVAYYTVQFVPPRIRQDLLNRVYEALNWGGAFILFEKVRAPDARFQDIASGVYTDFKLENGFDPAEIVNKTRSLKGVLEPFSTQGNLDLLGRAGFVDIMTVMKYIPFEGFLAIK